MKTWIPTFIVIASFSFLGACSKSGLDSKFVGTWKPQDSSKSAITTFSPDHTWKTCLASGEVSTSGTWLIKDKQLFLTATGSTPPDPISFDIQQVNDLAYIITHKNEKTGEVYTTSMTRVQ